MSLVDYAKNELQMLTRNCPNKETTEEKIMQLVMIDVVKEFSQLGHTNYSAPYAIAQWVETLKRLLSYKPLTLLTGEDDEWKFCYEDKSTGAKHYQNKRCGSVFKEIYLDGNQRAYWNEGRVFSDDDGETWYQNRYSRIDIDFPFAVPDKPEYIKLQVVPIRDSEGTLCMDGDNVQLPDGRKGILRLTNRNYEDVKYVHSEYCVGLQTEDVKVKGGDFLCTYKATKSDSEFCYSETRLDEHLYSLSDCIENLLERDGEDLQPKLSLCRYQRVNFTKKFPYYPGCILEDYLEKLDDELGDPDGCWTKPDTEMLKLERELYELIRKNYNVYDCEFVDTVDIDTKPWVENWKKRQNS